MSHLYVAIKGQLPTDFNNPTGTLQPGYIASYAITDNMTLAAEPTKITSAVPYSITEDIRAPGVYFSADAGSGYSAFRANGSMATQGTIPLQEAVSCDRAKAGED